MCCLGEAIRSEDTLGEVIQIEESLGEVMANDFQGEVKKSEESSGAIDTGSEIQSTATQS